MRGYIRITFWTFFLLLFVISDVPTSSLPLQYRQNWIDPIKENSSDNVECFLDYMELWVQRRQIDGLVLWLSRVMRFPVSLNSLDRTNHILSRCRYFLDRDTDGNFIFRVHYSACNVQKEKGFYSLEIHMVTKTSQGHGQSDRYIMNCPAMNAALGREKVLCEPHYVQVWRPMPLGDSKDQSHWFLSFRGELVVSVEDASLIGVEVEMTNSGVTVRGPRVQLMSAKEFMHRQTDVLPLWLVHGFYAYSLEASCPLVSRHPGAEVTMTIPKQRVGLVKRGSYNTETLTLRNIAAGTSMNVTLTENKHFVIISIPSNEVLQTKECQTTIDHSPGVQLFYRIDFLLEFIEMAYPMNWTMENYYECVAASSQVSTSDPLNVFSKPGNNTELSFNVTTTRLYQAEDSVTHSVLKMARPTTTLPSIVEELSGGDISTLGQSDVVSSEAYLDMDISGSGDYPETQSPALDSRIKHSSSILKLPYRPTQESYLMVSTPHRSHGLQSVFTTGKTNISNLHKSIPLPSNSQNNTATPQPNFSNNRSSEKQKIKQQPTTESSEQGAAVTSSSILEDSTQNNRTLSATATKGRYMSNNNSLSNKDSNKLLSDETPRPTISSVSKVSDHGASVAASNNPMPYSPYYSEYVDSQDFDLQNSAVIISKSSHWPRDESWKVLPMGTEPEFLDATSRDGFIPLISSNAPSRRNKERDPKEQEKIQVAPTNNQEMVIDQRHTVSKNDPTLSGNLQHYARSSLTEFNLQQTPLNSDHVFQFSGISLDANSWLQKTQWPNTAMEESGGLEQIPSDEQLMSAPYNQQKTR